jgi:hypothetical protein
MALEDPVSGWGWDGQWWGWGGLLPTFNYEKWHGDAGRSVTREVGVLWLRRRIEICYTGPRRRWRS